MSCGGTLQVDVINTAVQAGNSERMKRKSLLKRLYKVAARVSKIAIGTAA